MYAWHIIYLKDREQILLQVCALLGLPELLEALQVELAHALLAEAHGLGALAEAPALAVVKAVPEPEQPPLPLVEVLREHRHDVGLHLQLVDHAALRHGGVVVEGVIAMGVGVVKGLGELGPDEGGGDGLNGGGVHAGELGELGRARLPAVPLREFVRSPPDLVPLRPLPGRDVDEGVPLKVREDALDPYGGVRGEAQAAGGVEELRRAKQPEGALLHELLVRPLRPVVLVVLHHGVDEAEVARHEGGLRLAVAGY
mmetsp:Transcript_24320/g.48383  ORF Transcript_24320/g.48383 Transcript_24320/m.48383 type:complete len:256 (+) Transcript_24320:74-841(+)